MHVWRYPHKLNVERYFSLHARGFTVSTFPLNLVSIQVAVLEKMHMIGKQMADGETDRQLTNFNGRLERGKNNKCRTFSTLKMITKIILERITGHFERSTSFG